MPSEPFVLSKVPCRVAIRSADAVIQEVPEAKKTSLWNLARIPEKNSERDVHRLSSKFDLAIPIPLSQFTVGRETFHYLKMSDWVRFLLERNLWHHLAGLEEPNAEKCRESWLGFWQRFRKIRLKHEVFEFPEKDLSRCCGLLLHGDEGRSARKSAILVLAAHSILGYGIRSSSHQCKSELHKLNYKMNTWVTRYLLGVLPKGKYSSVEGDECETEVGTSNVYDALLKAVADDLRSLFDTGVISPLDGHRYYFCIINVMGDWPFLQKCGNLQRSFFNAAKHANSTAAAKGICHRCLADKYDIPWEDLESDTPQWVGTMNTELPFSRPPVLLCVPHIREDPAELFAWDLFHTWHLGVGKPFLGTAVVALAMSSAFTGSIPDRLEAVSDCFQAWCAEHRFTPHLRKLSKENLSWLTTTTYPSGTWSKGHTTRVLNKWFISECRAHPEAVAEDRILKIAYTCAVNIENFLKGLYGHELWIHQSKARVIASYGELFLKWYGRGVALAYRNHQRLFLLQPNLHRFHHIVYDFKIQSQNCEWIINPLAFSTQPEEDYIGRPSRVSRRVSARMVIQRTLQRSLIAAHASYRNAGFFVGENWK